ncbi:hypothetical protein SUGI_1154030 [Cryptomeria japonica]|nr:hypothetical protein SUGI_1154030 [Cryptomeria japonica]
MIEKWSARKSRFAKKGQKREVRLGSCYIPEGRSKRNSEVSQDRQRNVKWKMADVDWDENVISEHEEIRENTIPRARFKDTNLKNIIRNPKQIEVDLSDEVDDDRSIFENHTIIGRVIGPKLPRITIRSWADEHWGKHVVIKFLPKATQYIYNPGLLISTLLSLAIYDKPLWICLYNLPLEYWSNPSLERIGRTLGTLLEIDEAIIDVDLYTYARLKIAVVKEILVSISNVTKEGRWDQHVEIQKDITPCTRCGSRLHTFERCGMFVRKAFKKPPSKSN